MFNSLEEFLAKANSTPMYLLAGGIILLVLFQAFLFLIKAWNEGKKSGMDMKKLRKVIVSSATFTFLPSVAILIGVLALAPSLGVPLPWVRLSVVGSLQYEGPTANNVAKGLGLGELPSEHMTAAAFSSIAFAMTFGVMTTSVFILFFYKMYQKKLTKVATADTKLTDVIFCAGFMGMVAAYVGDAFGKLRTMTLENGTERPSNILYLISCIVSALFMIFFTYLIKKKKMAWLENYAFAFSMLLGMAAAVGGQFIFPTLSTFVE